MSSPARKSITTPRSSSATALRESSHTPTAIGFLRPFLPVGWGSYFSSVRAGKYWGLRAKCPDCGEAAPKELKYGYRKWRWLSVHLALHHPTVTRKITPISSARVHK